MIFAGIWQFWGVGENRLAACTILTVPASEQIYGIHHRMPLFIEHDNWALWLGEKGVGASKLMKTPSDINLDLVNISSEIKSTLVPEAISNPLKKI